jgi:two-component system response regulator TctD
LLSHLATAGALTIVRILVIEDSIDLAREVAEVLRDLSHEVFIDGGDSLEDALARLAKDAFDVVVVDLGLPGWDGSALVDALALVPDAPAIIVATGYGESQVGPLRSKVDGVLRKPFTVEQLGAVVDGIAERRSNPRSGVRSQLPTRGRRRETR